MRQGDAALTASFLLVALVGCASAPPARDATAIANDDLPPTPDVVAALDRAATPFPTLAAIEALESLSSDFTPTVTRRLTTILLTWLDFALTDPTTPVDAEPICAVARELGWRRAPDDGVLPPDARRVCTLHLVETYVHSIAKRASRRGSLDPFREAIVRASGGADDCPTDDSVLAAYARALHHERQFVTTPPRHPVVYGAPGRCSIATLGGSIELSPEAAPDDTAARFAPDAEHANAHDIWVEIVEPGSEPNCLLLWNVDGEWRVAGFCGDQICRSTA